MDNDKNHDYYDISPIISARLAVFPGDRAFAREVLMDFVEGDHLLLSSIMTTVHLGAHTDAPNHYHAEGVGIDQRPLDFYIGPCQVLKAHLPRGERILPHHLSQKITAPRVIFRTDSFAEPDIWVDDFNSLSPELVNLLATQGVRLVGIDTPSIDPATAKDLSAHQAVYRHDMAILEGVTLREVPDGVYTLVALPLKIEGADASPVRAVLFKKPL